MEESKTKKKYEKRHEHRTNKNGQVLEVKVRKCLKCMKKFKATGFYFLCPSCRSSNSHYDENFIGF